MPPPLRAASGAVKRLPRTLRGPAPVLRATSSAAKRLLGGRSTSLHASASVLFVRSPRESIGGPYV
jgi:hypothetical protein